MTSIANRTVETAAINALEKERFYQRTMEKWLKGYSIDSICHSEGDVTKASVIQAINIKREELQEAQEASLEHLVAERIGGLRQIQQEAHEYMEYMPEKAAQLLTVALRAEESVAKIQGVLSDKVLHLGRIQHEIKMYDFEDNMPAAFAKGVITSSSSGPLILQEEILPPIEPIAIINTDKMTIIPIPIQKEIITPALRIIPMREKFIDIG